MSNTETLYHYCSNEAFHSIIKSRTIRLNDISHSNDYMEGKWIENTLINLLKREISAEQLSFVIRTFKFFHSDYNVFAFCLSPDSDVLSQWRGYADDGYGVAIGFDKKFLKDTWKDKEIYLLPIIYDELEQRKYLKKRGRIDRLKEAMELFPFDGATNYLRKLAYKEKEEIRQKAEEDAVHLIYQIMLKSYLIKNTAFSEEKEFRLIKNNYSYEKYESQGKNKTEIDLSVTRDKLTPFISLDLKKPADGLYSDHLLITEIKLGPKNQTPIKMVEYFLEKYGFPDVEITKSEATYR